MIRTIFSGLPKVMKSVLPKVSVQSVRSVWFLDVVWSDAFGVALSDAGSLETCRVIFHLLRRKTSASQGPLKSGKIFSRHVDELPWAWLEIQNENVEQSAISFALGKSDVVCQYTHANPTKNHSHNWSLSHSQKGSVGYVVKPRQVKVFDWKPVRSRFFQAVERWRAPSAAKSSSRSGADFLDLIRKDNVANLGNRMYQASNSHDGKESVRMMSDDLEYRRCWSSRLSDAFSWFFHAAFKRGVTQQTFCDDEQHDLLVRWSSSER